MPSVPGPTVSVVVPAYNAAKTLSVALDSLLAQQFDDWEAIVIDDGSTDDTADVARSYAASDGRFRLLTQSNGGVSSARNAGLRQATGEWVLFLDADDRMTHDGLTALADAALTTPFDWLFGGWRRVFGDEVQAARSAWPIAEPKRVLATVCPFAIHACLVRRAAVDAVKGFDAAFRTCEDWDLWRRLANRGLAPCPVDSLVADYIVRPGSASLDAEQLLRDGLQLIARGHQDADMSADESRRAQAAFCAYAAGIAIGAGTTPESLAELAEPISAPDLDPAVVADMLHSAVALGCLVSEAQWPLHRYADVLDWLSAFERSISTSELARRTAVRLSQRIGRALERSAAPVLIGSALQVDLDIDQPPLETLVVPDGVERVQLRGFLTGRLEAVAELLPLDREIGGSVQLDALLERSAWSALEQLVLTRLSSQLEVRQNGRVLRDGVRVGEVSDRTRTPSPTELVEIAGWTLFLQEVFGDRRAEPDDFYTGKCRGRARPVNVEGGIVRVETTEGPVALRSREPFLRVQVTLGGEPLDDFVIETRSSGVSAGRLRTQIVIRNGLGLLRVAMRSLLGRDRTVVDDSRTPIFASGPSSSANEWPLRPDEAPWPTRSLLHPAPVPDDAKPRRGAKALVARADAQSHPPRSTQRPRAFFETLFESSPDPWAYATGYERRKYEQTLSLLPSTPTDVLELACAEGHFTALLAKTAKRVVATDISTRALDRAAARCASADNVEFRQHDLFTAPIDGRWPAIVCSEVLYYAGSVAELQPIVRRILRAVEPGGVFVTAHANLVVDDPSAPGFDWAEEYGALGIQRAVLATGLAVLEEEIVTPMYRVQRYRRRHRMNPFRSAPPRTHHTDADPDLSADVQAHFLPYGGAPEPKADSDAQRLAVPTLMYHRVAPEGATSLRRYRVTPSEFEAQLDLLRRAGYTSITPAKWRDAVTLGIPLPSQPVMFTFDDGFQDFADHALPLLEQYEFTATVFVVTSRAGDRNHWDAGRETYPLMGWDTLKDLRDHGIELGAHTQMHRPLTALTPQEVVREISGSLQALTAETGHACSTFAYPFGDMSDGVRRLAGYAGAEMAFTCEHRVIDERDDALSLPRLEVRGDRDPLRDLAAALTRR